MTPEERMAEVLTGLRHLAQHPSPENARHLLEDWQGQRDLYDTTASSWRPAREQTRP